MFVKRAPWARRFRRNDCRFRRRIEPSPSAVRRAGILASSAVFAALFLGGWQANGMHVLVGGIVFLLKTSLVASVAALVTRWMPTIETRALPSPALRRSLPALVIGSALLLSARRFAPSAAVELAFGVAVLVTTSMFGIRLVSRVRAAVARPEPHASPFL